jgi:hypothetical protein
MEDKTETVLDHTYLGPGIVTWAVAIGLVAMGIGAGLLFACYGASFFFNTNSKRLDALTAKAEEIAQRPDRAGEVIAKLDDLRQEAGKIDANMTNHFVAVERDLEGLKSQPFIRGTLGKNETPNGNVITTEVSVFKIVPHDTGKIFTGWDYPNGASANQPPKRQYCYWANWPSGSSSGTWVNIDLAKNGMRLPNISDGVPQLEDALKKCVWWNGSAN